MAQFGQSCGSEVRGSDSGAGVSSSASSTTSFSLHPGSPRDSKSPLAPSVQKIRVKPPGTNILLAL